MIFFVFIIGVPLAEIRVSSFSDTTARLVSIYPEIEGVDTIEALIFKSTNEEREKRGLKSLALDERLQVAARQHSNDMLIKRYLSHDSALQRVYNSGLPVLVIGENVAENIGSAVPSLLRDKPDSLVKLVMKGWMNSPGHRKNILNSDFTHIGIGSVVRGEMHKVTQDFADESDFAVDSVLAKVESKKYLVLFYLSSFVSGIGVFDNGEPVEEDSLYVHSGQIGVPIFRDSSLHKIELCLREQQFYRCGVRLFIHTGPPPESIFQPSTSNYK
jgi:uncharacterized protein YkwD